MSTVVGDDHRDAMGGFVAWEDFAARVLTEPKPSPWSPPLEVANALRSRKLRDVPTRITYFKGARVPKEFTDMSCNRF